jgi:chromosome segregation ATPase
VQRAIDELKHVFSVGDIASHGRPQPAMSGSQKQDETTKTGSAIDGHGPTVSDTDRQESESERFVEQLQKRIDEKDATIEFLQEELTDRRAQISGMKQIIDGQRQLLETINSNVAPVFGALAKLVAPKGRDGDDPIVAKMVNDAGREAG